MTWSWVVFVVILRWSVTMCNLTPRAWSRNYGEIFVTPSVFWLGVIKLAGPEGHKFVVFDNISSHLIAGSVSVNVKWFIMVGISKKAVLLYNSFHVFESEVHFVSPATCFFRLTGERCKNVCMLGPHTVVVVDSTKETTRLWKVFWFLHL